MRILATDNFKSATKDIPAGLCFQFSYQYMREQAKAGKWTPKDAIVHGTVSDPWDKHTFEHAWVEQNGRVIDWQNMTIRTKPGTQKMVGPVPIAKFYQMWKPHNLRRFNDEQSMVSLARNRHYGPWPEFASNRKQASIKHTETPEFKNWFGKSRVLEPFSDRPLQVYHGTTHQFTQFNKRRSDPDNYMGQGFYFSNQPQDVSRNYANLGGPDLTRRIEGLAEEIFNRKYPDGGPSYGTEEYLAATAQCKKEAEKRLSGGKPSIMPAYLKMERPLDLSRYDGTTFSITYVENRRGDIVRETGNGIRLIKAMKRVASRYGIDGDKLVEEVMTATGYEWEEMPAHAINKAIREAEVLQTVEDRFTGKNVAMNFIRDIYTAAGFDGVIMDAYSEFGPRSSPYGKINGMDGMNPDTKHYIVFHPRQIKSPFNGTFDPKNRDITAQSNGATKE